MAEAWRKAEDSPPTDAQKRLIKSCQATPVDCAKIYRAIRPILSPNHDEMDAIQSILAVIGKGIVLNAVLSGRIVGSIGFEYCVEGGIKMLKNYWFFIDLSYQKTRISEKLINEIVKFSQENGILAMFGDLTDYRAGNREAFLRDAGLQLTGNSLMFDGRGIPS